MIPLDAGFQDARFPRVASDSERRARRALERLAIIVCAVKTDTAALRACRGDCDPVFVLGLLARPPLV